MTMVCRRHEIGLIPLRPSPISSTSRAHQQDNVGTHETCEAWHIDDRYLGVRRSTESRHRRNSDALWSTT